VSIFHIWEKTYDLCLSGLDLLHLTWCPPIASIYLQTTWFHSSLWLSKTPLCIHDIYCTSTYILSGISQGVVLLDHMAVLFLGFWGVSILFSMVVVLIYIPTSIVWGSFSPTSLLIFTVVCILNGSHSNRSEVELYHGFDLYFLYGQGCWAFLHVFLTIHTSSFKKAPSSSFAHFFIGLLIFGGV
jgi:hypothetical protein